MKTLDLSTNHSKYQHIPRNGVLLNAIKITFSANSFSLYTDKGSGEHRQDREDELGSEWLLKRRGNDLHGLPRTPNPERGFGERVIVDVQSHLGILARRLEELVSLHFSKKDTVDGRDLSFLGTDLLHEALDAIRAPTLAYGFSVRTRFDFEARVLDPDENNGAFVGLVVRPRTKWQSEADLVELAEAGVDLHGLYVLRRAPQEAEHRVAGRIERLDGATVILSDSPDGIEEIEADTVSLEPRRDAFARVMGTILKPAQSQRLERKISVMQSNALDGPAVEKLLSGTRKHLAESDDRWLVAEDLAARFGPVVALGNRGEYVSLIRSGSVSYFFDPGRSKNDIWSWRGLNQYGPFDQESFPRREPRLLVVCTDTAKGSAEQFTRALLDGVSGGRAYVGMRSVFRLPNIKVSFCVVPWLGSETASPGEAYRNAIEEHLRSIPAESAAPYDAAIVVILDEHSGLAPKRNPYLWSKALLLQNAIPVQQARYSTVKDRDAYAFQNISTALYAKMSGTPWTVAQDRTVSDELVIGMGMSEQGGRFGARRRLVGITTVFRGDGNYLLGYLAEQCDYEHYPEKLRSSTLHVLRRRKQEQGWRPGDTVRIVYHSYQRMRDVDIDRIVAECVAEVGQEQNVEFAFLTVTKDHPYTLLDVNQTGVPASKGSTELKAVFLPERGLIARVGRYERLITTLGPQQTRRGEPLKRPILVKLHRSSTFKELTYLSEQVLKFSSLSWRTVRPVKLPVTIRYSKHIAEQLAELGDVEYWSPASLNTRLGTSLWFL